MDASFVLSTIARIAVGATTSVLATVRCALRVDTHYVLFQVGLRHKTFGTQFTMILFSLRDIGQCEVEVSADSSSNIYS